MTENEKTGILESDDGLPFFAYYGGQYAALASAIAPFQNPKDIREHVVAVLFQAIHETSETLLVTADKGLYRDCAVAARTLFETLVNTLYILASDESVAQLMVDHANMKMTRDLDRTIQSGSSVFKLQHGTKDIVMKDKYIKEVWQKFKTSSGAEDRRWTKMNIDERLQTIEEVFGTNVSAALVFPYENYRFASEVIHGTLYGVLYSRNITLTDRPVSNADREDYVRKEILKLMIQLSTAFGSAALAIAKDEVYDEIHPRMRATKDQCLPQIAETLKRWEKQRQE